MKKGHILAYTSRGIKSVMMGKTMQQAGVQVAEAGGCLVTPNPHTESRELTGNGDNCSNMKASGGGALHIQTMKDERVSEWMVIRMNGEWWVNQ